MTTTIRSKPFCRTRTSSPGPIGCAGFARSPFTRTCPALHAAVAAERVLVIRTAQIQLSTRALAIPSL
ncbi:hypothetical protein QP157_16295 [Sphingomonas sp. LR61]